MPKNHHAKPGTTDQLPTWEGPPENRPAGYLPAEDNPEVDRDAAGENLQDPNRTDLSDAVTTKDNQPSREERIRIRAYQLWEQSGQLDGSHEDHWHQAEREIDEEDRTTRADGNPGRQPHPEFSQTAAHAPESGSEALANDGETTADDPRSSSRATPSPLTEKTAGAGPAIAERSKDAKAPRSGRQPGAYVKE